MNSLLSVLAESIDRFSSGEGLNASPVPGVHCIKLSRPGLATKKTWRTSVSIIAQGRKEIVLGRKAYWVDEAHYVATPIDLPVASRVASATVARPFLCLMVDLDASILSEVSVQLRRGGAGRSAPSQRALFIGKASEEMLEAGLRLVKLFKTPEDAPVLGRLVIRELLYHLLKGKDGPAIQRLVRSGSTSHRIFQCIHRLRSELAEDVDVVDLAKAANMSRSAFFKRFREVTAVSPIHYQKRLRLLEARRLMVDEGDTAERSALRVGYKSASQFSREYSRMFGNSPSRDAMKLRKSGTAELLPAPRLAK